MGGKAQWMQEEGPAGRGEAEGQRERARFIILLTSVCAPKRQAAKKRKSDHYIHEALEMFDYSKTNGLRYNELKAFLKHLDKRDGADGGLSCMRSCLHAIS